MAPRAGGAEDLARAFDRPALDQTRRVEPAVRRHSEVAVGSCGGMSAPLQHLPRVGMAVGDRDLAALQARDLAVGPVRREPPISLVQETHGRLEIGQRNLVAEIERHDGAHHMNNPPP